MRGGFRTDGFMVGSCSDHARIMVGSWSDHSRIGRALEMTFHPFSANFFEILDGHFSWQAQYLVSLDYDNHEIHFSWQAQYLVSLDNDTCYSAHCK